MLLPAFLLACSPPPPCAEGYGRLAVGACVALDDGAAATDSGSEPGPTGDSTTDSAPPDTAPADTAPGEAAFTEGDPILYLGSDDRYQSGSPKNPFDGQICHLTDAEVISAAYGIAPCDVGVTVSSVVDGSYVAVAYGEWATRVSWDPHTQTAWAATRSNGIYPVDLSDPTQPVTGALWAIPEEHEDIAADDGRVLLAARGHGTLLLDGVNQEVIATADATESLAVALEGDVGLAADGEELILYRVDGGLEELDRVTLQGTGRDLDVQGDLVGVALGGSGVQAFRIVDDTLEELGHFELPGPAYSVALDGEDLWVGAWETTVLIWLGDGGPIVVGHEAPQQWSTGVGALDGAVLVADWFYSVALQRVPGVAGPELVIDDEHWIAAGTESLAVTVKNDGAFDLTVELSPPGGGSIDPQELWLAPGEAEAVLVTLPAGFGDNTEFRYTSNDPDETEGAVTLRKATETIGTAHEDFTLWGFTPPSSQTQTYTLSDHAGKVVFLAYFSIT